MNKNQNQKLRNVQKIDKGWYYKKNLLKKR